MNKKSKLRTIYCTFPTKASAEDLAFDLVTEKLAACVNIFPLEASVYKWKQKSALKKNMQPSLKQAKKIKKTISLFQRNIPMRFLVSLSISQKLFLNHMIVGFL